MSVEVEKSQILQRLLISLGCSCISVPLLYTGCAIQQYQHGTGGWCVLIILGVFFQIFALLLYFINQKLRIKNEGEDAEEEEKRSEGDQQYIDYIILLNQLTIFVFGFVYLVSGVAMLDKNSNAATRDIWLVIVILGLFMLIIVAVIHNLDFPRFDNIPTELLTVSITVQWCVCFALIYSGTKKISDSIQNETFSYSMIFFIITSYLYHILSLLLIRKVSESVQQLVLILNLVLGLIYLISGVALEVSKGNIWLCVSILGGILFIISAIILLAQQPFIKDVVQFSCFEPKSYFKDDVEAADKTKEEKTEIPPTMHK